MKEMKRWAERHEVQPRVLILPCHSVYGNRNVDRACFGQRNAFHGPNGLRGFHCGLEDSAEGAFACESDRTRWI